MTVRLAALVADLRDELVAVRRDLHAHPELGMEERRTADVVARKLEEWGIEAHRGVPARNFEWMPTVSPPDAPRLAAPRVTRARHQAVSAEDAGVVDVAAHEPDVWAQIPY